MNKAVFVKKSSGLSAFKFAKIKNGLEAIMTSGSDLDKVLVPANEQWNEGDDVVFQSVNFNSRPSHWDQMHKPGWYFINEIQIRNPGIYNDGVQMAQHHAESLSEVELSEADVQSLAQTGNQEMEQDTDSDEDEWPALAQQYAEENQEALALSQFRQAQDQKSQLETEECTDESCSDSSQILEELAEQETEILQ